MFHVIVKVCGLHAAPFHMKNIASIIIERMASSEHICIRESDIQVKCFSDPIYSHGQNRINIEIILLPMPSKLEILKRSHMLSKVGSAVWRATNKNKEVLVYFGNLQDNYDFVYSTKEDSFLRAEREAGKEGQHNDT